MYQTLYRKYRPSNLDEVVGQNIIVKTLKNAIINKKLAHAYLFTGPRGTGKTSVAKILAKTVNCISLDNTNPCNKCINCKQNIKNSIDIIEIDAASNNGVDEIRELKSKVSLVPSLNQYKVYIIDEVHMLTTGAFNALLKTLEEPPAHIIFILATTEPHKIPMTILSRCQRFDFKRINKEDIINRLKYIVNQEQIKIDDTCLNEIARISNGGMRDALSLLDQVNAYSDNNITIGQIHEINGTLTPLEIKEFIINMVNNDLEKILKLIDKYDYAGKDFVKLSEEIILYLKNLLYKINVPKYFETLNVEKKDYEIKNINLEKTINYIQIFNDVMIRLKRVNNPKLIFELNIIKILNNDLIPINNSKKIKSIHKIEKTKLEATEINKNKDFNINQKKLDELEKIRINNTLCNFNKKNFLEMKENIKEINRLIIDPEYSEYASIVLDGNLKAVGDNHMIFVFKNKHDAKIYNENVKKIDEMLKFIFNEEYVSIATDIDKWEKIKQEYNQKQKKYEYIKEPKELINSLIIKKKENNIEEFFGNIVEYK